MRFKKSSLLTKLLLLVMVVYAAITLVSLQNQVTVRETEAVRLQAEIDEARQENLRLEQAIEMLDTDEGVEAVARQKLGLVTPGEIVYYDVGN